MNYSGEAQRMLDQAGPTMSVPEAALIVFNHRGKSTGYQMLARGAFAEAGIKVICTGRRYRVVTSDVRRLLAGSGRGGDG